MCSSRLIGGRLIDWLIELSNHWLILLFFLLTDRFFQRQAIIAKQIQKHPELRASYTAKLYRVEENDDKVDDIQAINAKLNEVETILDKIEEHLRMNASVAGMCVLLSFFPDTIVK